MKFMKKGRVAHAANSAAQKALTLAASLLMFVGCSGLNVETDADSATGDSSARSVSGYDIPI